MSRYVPKHARQRRGLWRVAVLPTALLLLALVVVVGFGVRDSQPVAAGPSLPSPDSESNVPTVSSDQAPSTTVPATTAASRTAVTISPTTTTTIRVHPIANPVRLEIPAIEVDAELVPVGLLDNGDMEVPDFGLAGWYQPGPVPGGNGPAVLVAHVDTKKGPDVFYHLKELKTGDEILVYDQNGDVARFAVDSTEQQLKVDLPVERIWNDTWEPVIRLITCGGEFDRTSGHYLSNVIVYGHLVE